MFTYVGYSLLIYLIFRFKTRKRVLEDKREREKIKPMTICLSMKACTSSYAIATKQD